MWPSPNFRKLIALQPNSLRERLKLAETLSRKGDHNGAIQALGEAIKVAPQDLNANLQLADQLSRAGRVEEAQKQYQALLQAHPDNAMVLNNMAFFLSQSGGSLDQALGLAQRAMRIAPGQPVFSDTMGYIYLKKGLKDSAVQVFGNLVKKYPAYPMFRYHFGMALLENGDKKGAKKELEDSTI